MFPTGGNGHAFISKSPETGGVGEAVSHGTFGAEIKRAGYDALIRTREIQRPVYLWIDDDSVQLFDRGLLTSVPKANREVPTSRSAPGQPTRRGNIHPMMNAIGGTSIHYWAQSWRLKPWDFKTRSEVTAATARLRCPKARRLKTGPSVTTISNPGTR